jgi:CRISPR-associated protein Csb2
LTERAAIARAVDGWHEKHGRRAEDGEGVVVPIHLGRSGDLIVSIRDDGPRPGSPLRPRVWCSASRVWASATPLALDRNPGDLRANDPRIEAAAYADAEATVAAACQHIGLPRPTRVTVLPAAPLAGAEKARAFPPFATGKPPIQRVLVHALLTFDSPVRGPILLGAGRYVGLGLFRPLEDRHG